MVFDSSVVLGILLRRPTHDSPFINYDIAVRRPVPAAARL